VQREALRVKSRILFAVLAAGACLVAGCGAPPMNYVLSDVAKKTIKGDDLQKLSDALDNFFGTPAAPKIAESLKRVIKSNEQELADGATSYRRLCMHCHGLSGDGNGPTAKFLLPLPRDYRRGLFKFTSTDQMSSPTRDDLMRTLKNGVPGTSMPSFALFDEQEIERVLDYVILLSIRGRAEASVAEGVETGTGDVDAEAVADAATSDARRWATADGKIIKPKVARTAADERSIENGKRLFLSAQAQCTKCHGKEGRGDGFLNDPNADPKDTKDSWGNQARPANLTLGVFRGGGRPIDLFRRLHSGVKGTPMAAQATSLKDEEIWDLVNFVLYLPYHESALLTKPSEKEHASGGS
jgi:mono/diheme cytochrome c family protein